MKELRKFNWREFKDRELRRSFFRAILLMGDSGISDPHKLLSLKSIKNDMTKIYSSAKITVNNTLVSLEPDVTLIFTKQRDYDYLSQVWKSWRHSTGKQFQKYYPDYVKLSNEATREYGFADYGDYSRSSFEADNLNQMFDEIYAELEDLYRLLHSYVKKRLIEIYPDKIKDERGPLPAHVFGDLWAQQWHNIYEDIKPYKNKSILDITPNMIKKVTSGFFI